MKAQHMCNVLILDEDDLVVKMLSKALKVLGYHPIPCSGTDTALETLDHNQVSAVILEVFLTNGQGFECLKRLRQLMPHALILAMAGGSGTVNAGASLESIKQCGADAVLRKPVEMEQLERQLARVARFAPATNTQGGEAV